MKKIISFMLILCVIFSFAGCGEKQHEYSTGSWSTVRNDAENNLASAKEKYVGKYYSFTGETKYIIDKDFFSVYEVNPGYYTSGVTCSVKDKDLQEIVLSLKEGDMVTVKGKITSIDFDTLGRTAKMNMKVDEIIKSN